MRRLIIPHHLESSINTVFNEANEERRRNGLPEIRVLGERAFISINLSYGGQVRFSSAVCL